MSATPHRSPRATPASISLFRSAVLACLISVYCAPVWAGTCIGGGYYDYPDPVFLSFRGRILVGGAHFAQSEERRKSKTENKDTALRVYDPKSHTLSERIREVDNLKYGVRVGAATRSMVFVGGPQGASFSRDLVFWESIPALAGKSITSITTTGDDVWLGSEGSIYHMDGVHIGRRYAAGKGKVVNLSIQGQKIVFSLIRETTPPQGYCSPYLVLSEREAIDVTSGKITETPPPPSESEGVNSNTNPLAKMWAIASAAYPLPMSDLMDALELYYGAEASLPYFPFWNNVLRFLSAENESERLKRMFKAADDHGKRQILAYTTKGESSFVQDLLTLAVDRRDYLRDDLVRTISRHDGDYFTGLLIRILREGATEKQDPRNRNHPYQCASGEAADAILKRMGEEAIPILEEVVENPSTNPIVSKSITDRLSNWYYDRKKHTYNPPRLRKAYAATGQDAVVLLDDADANVRFQALQRLQGTPDSIPFSKLVSLLDDTGYAGPLAAQILGKSTNPKAPEALLKALKSPQTSVRVWAMISLGKLREARAYPALIEGLTDRTGDIRSAAAKGLAELGDTRAVPALIEAASRKGPTYDYGAESSISALAKLGDKRAIPTIIETLKSEHMGYRSASAQALGELKAESAVGPLIQALKDSNAQVRREAIWALGKIGDPIAIESLEELQEADSFTQSAIQYTIKKLRALK